MFAYEKCSVFRFIAPSPKIPIPHNHKTITFPLAAFFFTHTIIDQPPKREPEVQNIKSASPTTPHTGPKRFTDFAPKTAMLMRRFTF
ncbi:hypothetical protein CFP56_010504 [Quercus suber]|uniref:Uncharacterized protein n=1 Tax=Quercus suber TaxID=58331 RepID=A0AAW0M5I3_QUESU|nr:hypothetical protein CFP56_75339 [Quercus suber]